MDEAVSVMHGVGIHAARRALGLRVSHRGTAHDPSAFADFVSGGPWRADNEVDRESHMLQDAVRPPMDLMYDRDQDVRESGESRRTRTEGP